MVVRGSLKFVPHYHRLNAVKRLCTGIQSEKLQSLTTSLLDKKKRKGDEFRCLVFVQQRISAYVLSHYLSNHQKCKDWGILAGYVAAMNSRITPSIKMRSGDAAKTIADFREGDINVIIATSVIEEGFDVPQANVVISYDYVKDTVELAQRFGRARQKDSSLTLMWQREDRPLSALKDVKIRQESIIKAFNPALNQDVSQARQQSQNDRERAAFTILTDMEKCERSPKEAMNVYASKTKAVVREFMVQGTDKIFRCKFVYSSVNRTVEGEGEGTTKKDARHKSASKILDRLREIDMLKYKQK